MLHDEDDSEADDMPAYSVSVPQAERADPSTLGWPPTLPVELALRVHTPQELCEAYGISRQEWGRLCKDSGFRTQVARYVEMVKADGVSFRLKAQLQSEELLRTAWAMIHNPDTPANVRADLIKSTWRCAGLDASKEGVAQGVAFSINLNLG